ncbi:putative GPR1/FUN34/yaaH family protein [Trypanosoma theileri]|uniref:Putative GPR1/FUN34/yaaH family protein n=1 Tax=Trypanosoma theileri TaxID=67003 RepID=A0A1X0P8Q4_9TRYP|nr:putative GPR1/FUN34/yaaH family protein [Trypanosoma theileri]ORC93327.1 putative GPR1/FUN34/yaaH family protein [Trypanosoma theileri]
MSEPDNNGIKTEVPITNRQGNESTRDGFLEPNHSDCLQTEASNANNNNGARACTCGCGCTGDFRTKLADPGPLGFIAFGMTTLLFNISNAELCPMNTTTAGMVLCYGGSTQVLAGIMEFVRGNTFGCTISTTFGAFWLATACMWLLPRQTEQTPYEYLVEAQSDFLGAFFLMWAVFAYVMCASALRQPLVLVFVIFTAGFNFTLQCISFWSRSQTLARVAGFEGMVCGASAMYAGLALTVNDSYNSIILPLLHHTRGRIHLKKK